MNKGELITASQGHEVYSHFCSQRRHHRWGKGERGKKARKRGKNAGTTGKPPVVPGVNKIPIF